MANDIKKTSNLSSEIAMQSYKTTDANWYAPKIPKADSVIRIKFRKLTETATLPRASKEGDIGFDIFCDQDFELLKGECRVISTGIQLADMPIMDNDRNRIFLKIEGRSGLSAKGVFPSGGIIDPTYRGECKVVLNNMPMGSNQTFKRGDRIAQFVIYKVATAGEAVMEESNVVTKTNRGSNGFGSTGT